MELTGPGLVTIERARLLTGDIGPVQLDEEPGEATMLTVYFGRRDRVYLVPAFEAVCELLDRRGIGGATVLPGTDGAICGRRQHARHLRRDADEPLMVAAVGSGQTIGMALPELAALFRHPVMTVEKVQVCQRAGQVVGRPRVLADGEPDGTAVRLKLTVYASEAARHDGQPVHRAIVRQLESAGIEGATTVHGIWGFRTGHAPHGGHFPRRGHHVPAVTTATGTPEQISAAFDVVGMLTAERGLVTAQTVLAVQPTAGNIQRTR